MVNPTPVPVAKRPVAPLAQVVGAERMATLTTAAAAFRERFAGHTIWNVSSTAAGGGVAEMLHALVGYVLDLGIDIRWLVIEGDREFFELTKRLHNRIHGQPGDSGKLGPAEHALYQAVSAANAAGIAPMISAGDIVLLHDPQTAGLAEGLRPLCAQVYWRCHIGADYSNWATAGAWAFLRPYLESAGWYVFSRRTYAPDFLPSAAVSVIPPSIDPFSAKNQELDDDVVRAVLVRIGVLDAPSDAAPQFTRGNGSVDEVQRSAIVTAERLPTIGDQLVLQVSRWDRLKDMSGVMRGFAESQAPLADGYLVLAGPAVAAISDDPEGAEVYAECAAQWRDLPLATRRRVALVNLPMGDAEENATMVNALQRAATVVVQKSIAEGFGLTVAEAMWKGRPIIGSAVGGIQDQIVDGTGVLLPDPTDLAAFGLALQRLLGDPEAAARMGAAGHRYVRENFVGDRHLLQYARLFTQALEGRR